MNDDPSSSDAPSSGEPATVSGKRAMMVMLAIAVALQIFFALLIWGTRRAKQSLPTTLPAPASTSQPAEHITNGDG